MIREHHPAGTNADGFRAARDMRDHDRGRGARDARDVVVFREPEAVVTPFLRVACEVERIAKGERSVTALDDRGEVEQGKMFHASERVRRGAPGVISAPILPLSPIPLMGVSEE